MAEKIIMMADARSPALAVPDTLETPTGLLADALGRPLHDLRISVTDRCNFRCVYCMPKDAFGPDHAFLPRGELLHLHVLRQQGQFLIVQQCEQRDGPQHFDLARHGSAPLARFMDRDRVRVDHHSALAGRHARGA